MELSTCLMLALIPKDILDTKKQMDATAGAQRQHCANGEMFRHLQSVEREYKDSGSECISKAVIDRRGGEQTVWPCGIIITIIIVQNIINNENRTCALVNLWSNGGVMKKNITWQEKEEGF